MAGCAPARRTPEIRRRSSFTIQRRFENSRTPTRRSCGNGFFSFSTSIGEKILNVFGREKSRRTRTPDGSRRTTKTNNVRPSIAPRAMVDPTCLSAANNGVWTVEKPFSAKNRDCEMTILNFQMYEMLFV